MVDFISEFWHVALVGFMAIFPPVNPLGTALIVEPHLSHLTYGQRKRAAFLISFYCFILCACTIVFGSFIFKFFGISLTAVQIAGGILISKIGFDILFSTSKGDGESDEVDEGLDTKKIWKKIQTSLFYPLAFPMTTGAGTISILLTLSADKYRPISQEHISNVLALSLGSFMMCMLVYICYTYSHVIIKHVGERGQVVMNRLSGFLTFCVGIQVFLNGVNSFVKSFNVS